MIIHDEKQKIKDFITQERRIAINNYWIAMQKEIYIFRNSKKDSMRLSTIGKEKSNERLIATLNDFDFIQYILDL